MRTTCSHVVLMCSHVYSHVVKEGHHLSLHNRSEHFPLGLLLRAVSIFPHYHQSTSPEHKTTLKSSIKKPKKTTKFFSLLISAQSQKQGTCKHYDSPSYSIWIHGSQDLLYILKIYVTLFPIKLHFLCSNPLSIGTPTHTC